MVTDRRSEPAHARHNQSRQKQSPSRKRKQCDPNQRERVDCEEVNKNPSILTFGFPPRKRPWMLFGKCRSTPKMSARSSANQRDAGGPRSASAAARSLNK